MFFFAITLPSSLCRHHIHYATPAYAPAVPRREAASAARVMLSAEMRDTDAR